MPKGALAVVSHVGPAAAGDAMSAPHALAALAALGQPTRLAIFRLLMQREPGGLLAGAIAEAVGCPPNTLSSHIAILARAGLVRGARDGRSIIYRADVGGHARVDVVSRDRLLQRSSGALRIQRQAERRLWLRAGPAPSEATEMMMDSSVQQKPFNVLFLCTGNSARSIMAEVILNRAGQGNFRAYSAGSHPKGQVHPYAVDLLRKLNFDVTGLRSKSWTEFAKPDAPKLDFVFTVCDDAAKESCPVWPGQPMTAHWGIPDPAAVEGTEVEKRLAFADALRMLTNRINIFVCFAAAVSERADAARTAQRDRQDQSLQRQSRIDAIMTEAPAPLSRRLLAEGLGTAILVATVVGSGIMAERLAGGNQAIALLGNTIPTGAILIVIITILGPISGAHFNPAVTLVFAIRGTTPWQEVIPYVAGAVSVRDRRNRTCTPHVRSRPVDDRNHSA